MATHTESKILNPAEFISTISAVYKKINGNWVLQENMASVFDPTVNYVKG